jgi:hypothetical protein
MTLNPVSTLTAPGYASTRAQWAADGATPEQIAAYCAEIDESPDALAVEQEEQAWRERQAAAYAASRSEIEAEYQAMFATLTPEELIEEQVGYAAGVAAVAALQAKFDAENADKARENELKMVGWAERNVIAEDIFETAHEHDRLIHEKGGHEFDWDQYETARDGRDTEGLRSILDQAREAIIALASDAGYAVLEDAPAEWTPPTGAAAQAVAESLERLYPPKPELDREARSQDVC